MHFLVLSRRGDKSRGLTHLYAHDFEVEDSTMVFGGRFESRGEGTNAFLERNKNGTAFLNVFRGTLPPPPSRCTSPFARTFHRAHSDLHQGFAIWRALLRSSMLCVSGIQGVIRCDDRIYIRHLASKSLANKKLKRVCERNYVNIYSPRYGKFFFILCDIFTSQFCKSALILLFILFYCVFNGNEPCCQGWFASLKFSS